MCVLLMPRPRPTPCLGCTHLDGAWPGLPMLAFCHFVYLYEQSFVHASKEPLSLGAFRHISGSLLQTWILCVSRLASKHQFNSHISMSPPSQPTLPLCPWN